ncbi:MAG: S41 family peptidase [Bacteroidota bacterium]
MKKTFSYLLGLLFYVISNEGFGQHLVLSPDELKQDFEIFRGSIEEMHPGLYWYSSKKEMDELFESIESSLDRRLTDLEFFRLLSRAIAKTRCVHTWITPSKSTNKNIWEGPLLPIQIRMVEDKAYFFKNHSEQKLPIVPGQQILEINGYSIDSLKHLSYQVHSGDGWITTGKKKTFERFFHFFYAFQVGQPDTYDLAYLDQEGKVSNTQVKAIPEKKFHDHPSSREHPNIQLAILNHSTTLLTVRAFDNWKEEGKKKKFLKELRTAFLKIDSAKTNNLIIDIRKNGGGTEKFGMKLCSYFIRDAFHGYKQIRFKTTKFKYRKYSKTSRFMVLIYMALLDHEKVNDTTYLLKNNNNLKPVKPSEPHFAGNTYILTNGWTYSTAADFSALMHSQGVATFIGEETGGGYRGNSGNYEFEFVLPNSKIRFNVPLAQYLTNVSYNTKNYGRGVIPDHHVLPTIENLINEVDTELDYTLSLIEKE